MDMNLFITFVILNVLNVIIQTAKTIITVKCGKGASAIANAIAYGLYTVVTVYMICELPLWLKVVVVGTANLIGVYVVKYAEEKGRKDRLWKIETTFLKSDNFIENLTNWGKKTNISFNYIYIEKYYIVNFYCPTQNDTAEVKKFINNYNGKYFISESKSF
jgi:hypothetical protein